MVMCTRKHKCADKPTDWGVALCVAECAADCIGKEIKRIEEK